jgi:hypothetical protein
LDDSLERKLRELIDRNEIWQVLQRYGRGLDRLDHDMVRSCYFEDAIDDHWVISCGVEDFIKFAEKSTLHYTAQHHGLMNHHCELVGDDAYCETYFLFTATVTEPPHFMSMGRYIDHFQRRNGEWRIANRVMVSEGSYELTHYSGDSGFRSPFGPEEAQPASRDCGDISYHRPPRPRRPRPIAA